MVFTEGVSQNVAFSMARLMMRVGWFCCWRPSGSRDWARLPNQLFSRIRMLCHQWAPHDVARSCGADLAIALPLPCRWPEGGGPGVRLFATNKEWLVLSCSDLEVVTRGRPELTQRRAAQPSSRHRRTPCTCPPGAVPRTPTGWRMSPGTSLHCGCSCGLPT
jgi:hypothetical protein